MLTGIHIFSFKKSIWKCRLENGSHLSWPQCVNIQRPRQNGRHFADDLFKNNFWKANVSISLKFVPNVRINNISAEKNDIHIRMSQRGSRFFGKCPYLRFVSNIPLLQRYDRMHWPLFASFTEYTFKYIYLGVVQLDFPKDKLNLLLGWNENTFTRQYPNIRFLLKTCSIKWFVKYIWP